MIQFRLCRRYEFKVRDGALSVFFCLVADGFLRISVLIARLVAWWTLELATFIGDFWQLYLSVGRSSLLAADQSIINAMHVDRWEGFELPTTIPCLVIITLLSCHESVVALDVWVADPEAVTAKVEAVEDALVNGPPACRTRLFIRDLYIDDGTALPVTSHLVHAIQLVEA